MRVPRPAGVILAEVTVFAAITLAAASLLFPVRAMAVTVTPPAVCVADSTDTGVAMCGAIGAPTMGPWFRRFRLERSRQLRIAAGSAARLTRRGEHNRVWCGGAGATVTCLGNPGAPRGRRFSQRQHPLARP